MSRHNIQPRPQTEANVDILSPGAALTPSVTSYDALSSAPRFRSLQDALKVACLDHAHGKISEADLPLIYSPDPSVAPVKSTHGLFYTITGVAFQDEGGYSSLESYLFIVEKGTLDYVLHSGSADSNTSASGPRVSSSYEVRAEATFKTRYQVRPSDLPPPESCPNSCRGLFERAVLSVRGKQAPVPLTTLSSSPSMLPPTSRIRSHGIEFCKPLDGSTTHVSCRVARFTYLSTPQVHEYVVVEFRLVNGEWHEVGSHYTIPVTFSEQRFPFEATHLSYKIFSLQESVLSHCWVKGSTDNFPSEPVSLSCESIGPVTPELAHDCYHDISIAPLSSSSLPLSNKRPRTNKQQFQHDQQNQNRRNGSKKTTPISPQHRPVLPKNVLLSLSLPADPSKVRPSCHLCKKTFSLPKGLVAHLNDIHSKIRPSFKCDICHSLFTRNSDMERHKTSKHKNEKCPCNRCGLLLSRGDGLLSHLRVCKDKRSAHSVFALARSSRESRTFLPVVAATLDTYFDWHGRILLPI
ncbi:MAG: hypothetical protein J3R72DRAFT_100571 [Linnemannia gamsii]|nr:MAG: hypothetical protein J3R72DRAFT_100571 [Linnemannia gamsii]